ncbi:Hypothetical predicted protein [Mytilus galloprovincialis]|uniref:Mab-21-like HhH/H2TH-like domain-containing protein n=1 Tax=Mytilus galloprovincialis TaxID=29158 RepID=A0A8B6EHX4_MYTGA|nr:Hypothetical predicted protein [Mytilus galloprovincialis]
MFDINLISPWLEFLGQEKFISSKLFREQLLLPGMIIHGPCQSHQDKAFDGASGFRCKEWITSAQQWIKRPRSTWPDNKLVSSIVQHGVLFVPIGFKTSPNDCLEWRISFVMAEKLLMNSFSHTQLLCYALLKILLKDVIKPKHEDLISSYFLKTIMFWLCEESNPSDWKPDRMISCFLNCLRRLIYCVKHRTCLHYFIPDNNLFEDRFLGDQQDSLLETLLNIYLSPLSSIFTTATFRNCSLNIIDYPEFKLKTSAMSCFTYPYTFMSTGIIISKHSIVPLKRAILARIYFSDKDVCHYILSLMCNGYSQMRILQSRTSCNKSFYKQYYRTLGSLEIGSWSDVSSSWLLLASVMYQCGRFQECIYITKYCLSKCTPDKIFLYQNNGLEELTVFEKMKEMVGLRMACKDLFIQDVIFFYPFLVLPTELLPVTDIVGVTTFPPVVYCNVLLFLCFHHLRDSQSKLAAFRDLQLTMTEMYFIKLAPRTYDIVNKCYEILRNMI